MPSPEPRWTQRRLPPFSLSYPPSVPPTPLTHPMLTSRHRRFSCTPFCDPSLGLSTRRSSSHLWGRRPRRHDDPVAHHVVVHRLRAPHTFGWPSDRFAIPHSSHTLGADTGTCTTHSLLRRSPCGCHASPPSLASHVLSFHCLCLFHPTCRVVALLDCCFSLLLLLLLFPLPARCKQLRRLPSHHARWGAL